jgi:hypothetical protein
MITNWLEFIWLGISTLALILSVRHFWDVSADLNYLDALGRNGVKRSVARAAAQTEAFKIAVHVAMFVGSAIMVFMYRDEPSGTPLNMMRLTRQIVLITVTTLLLIQTVMDRRMRRKILDIVGQRSTDSKDRHGDEK